MFAQAAQLIARTGKVAIKAGGGTRGHDRAVRRLAEAAGAAVILAPGSTGVLPDSHGQNMHVGGSKGSISGNHRDERSRARDHHRFARGLPDRLLRHRLQDGEFVININGELADALHYNNTLALPGDIARRRPPGRGTRAQRRIARSRDWLAACAAKKTEWKDYKRARFESAADPRQVWQRPVLSQPAAIKVVADFAK